MDEQDPKAVGTTRTARLVMSLETVLFEIGSMDRELVDAASEVDASTRRELRRRIANLSGDANELMTWLAEVRFEVTIN